MQWGTSAACDKGDTMTTTDIRRANDRARTRTDWLDSKHSFNFGDHLQPGNDGHGTLVVFNDDRVAGGGGFGVHGHRDMEIVTWVLKGRLAHQDSEGNTGELYPGLAQRMSAVRGIRHSEMNASRTEEVRCFVQMWITPDTLARNPGYEQLDMNTTLQSGGMHAVGHPGAIRIGQRDATPWVGRLHPGEPVVMPNGHHVHLFVATGNLTGNGENARVGTLAEGDAMRLTDAPAIDAMAGTNSAEVLAWVMN